MLINLEGLSIFGPGSEWFWGMTQCVVFTITLIAIYRQLRAQRSANAVQLMEALNKQWDDPRMLRLRLHTAALIRQGSGFEAIYPVLTSVCQFFEDMAGLRERGHIDTYYVWESWGRTIQFWWTILKPSIEQGRIVEGQPNGNAPFENLSRLMREMDAKQGEPPFEPNREFVNRRIDAMISQAIALQRIEQSPLAGVSPAGEERSPMRRRRASQRQHSSEAS
jgi:hypothetical protein